MAAQYMKPSSQVDHEAFLAREKGEDDEFAYPPREYAVEGNDLEHYVGVSPEYKTYGDENQKPLQSDEQKYFREFEKEDGKVLPKEDEEDGDDEGKDESSTPNATKPTTPPAVPTVPAK